MSPDKNGLRGNVIFIDTENTFRAERIFQIAEHRAINDPDDILRKIYVCKIYNTSHLEVIIQDLGKSTLNLSSSIVSSHFTEPNSQVEGHWRIGSRGSTLCFTN